MTKFERRVRTIGVILCEIFALFTVGKMIPHEDGGRLLMACGTLAMVLLPEIMERLFHCRFSLPVYIFGILYALGPLLGYCWNLYYIGIYWDKLLHTAGGVIFALIGLFFFDLLSKNEGSTFLRALFALCFSIAISVIWEFVEFGADQLLHTDMQQDTLVQSIHSYLLCGEAGIISSVENIDSVAVNGTVLFTGGYLDIGLVDTMQDMLVETLGALIVFAIHLITKGKFRVIVPVNEASQETCREPSKESD